MPDRKEAFVLFDYPIIQNNFFPFTLTQPIYHLNFSVFNQKQRWEKLLGKKIFTISWNGTLNHMFPNPKREELEKFQTIFLINSAIIPGKNISPLLRELAPNSTLFQNEIPLLAAVERDFFLKNLFHTPEFGETKKLNENGLKILLYGYELLDYLTDFISLDLSLLTSLEKPTYKKPFVHVIGEEVYHLGCEPEIGAFTVIDSKEGPVIFGDNVKVEHNVFIKGPCFIGPHSIIRSGTTIYGASSFGPHTRLGGEISNCIFFGYSNKQHNGFLGNSIVGLWVNIGAGVNNSNLKNNYSMVKLIYPHQIVETNRLLLGALIGDHTKISIMTPLNTGTVIGTAVNILGPDFPPKYVPPFIWDPTYEPKVYEFDKFLNTMETVMSRRNAKPDENYIKMLKELFIKTEPLRVNFIRTR